MVGALIVSGGTPGWLLLAALFLLASLAMRPRRSAGRPVQLAAARAREPGCVLAPNVDGRPEVRG